MQRRNILLGTVAGITLFLDFLTKFFAQKFLLQTIEILPFFRLELTKNSNLAFGIPFPRILIILLSVFVIIFLGNLFVKNLRKESKIGTISFALLFGGALGNLGERIFFGEVTDFISFLGIPNFNIADAALTIGTALLIILYQKVFIKV